MDILNPLLQLSFFAIFGVAIWRYVRQPSPIALALVGVFATTAGIFAISVLNLVWPGISQALQPLAIVLLMAQPFLIMLLITLIRPLPRWGLLAVFAGFVAASAGLLLPADRLVAVLFFVAGYFVLVEGAAAVLFVREGRRRYGLPRLRLALAGVATAFFGASIFVASVGAAATDPGAPSPTIVLARLAALGAGVGYLAAFVPPLWLRNIGQRAIAFDVARDIVAAQAGTEPGVLWRRLGLAARDILGARQVSIVDARGDSLAETDEDRASDSPGRAPAASERPLTEVEVPILVEDRPWARVTAELEGRPLFVEDDLQVIALLGLITVRAVEREEAIVRLGEARRELAESAAVRASEARFRALLEAHPNAVLAVDADGLVTWATGPTSELFGRPADQLPGVLLTELIQLDSPVLGEFSRANGDRQLETTGRRLDGTAFPADAAFTSFDLDGQRYELIVVSDASWRQEANLLRDRFLGILSHELRTPITSIYGGTQLLQKRAKRLDEAARSELLGSIAAESERLQRIIENLLVLARVERRADFFDPHPVVVRPVLSELVERERPLWPEMTIRLTVPPGLPLVAADEEYLSLILRNLLSNAAKYAGPQSVVEVSVAQADAELEFCVRDDGPGIRQEEAEQLFSLYFRSPTGLTGAQGAGIGLFVCRGLVKAMNGRIWARPRPEGGAEFGFTLPLYRETGEESPGNVAAAPGKLRTANPAT